MGLHLFSSWCPWDLNDTLTHRWIGRASQEDSHLLPWPPKSPDLTRCDFSYGFLLKFTCSPPMPLDLAELRQRIEHAAAGIDHQMLVRVWQELYVCIWNTCKVCTKTLRDSLSSGTNLSSLSSMVTDLQKHETPGGPLTCPAFQGIFREKPIILYPTKFEGNRWAVFQKIYFYILL